MRTADVELEPVDHVVAGFPAGQVNVPGEMASEQAAFRENNAVRLSDLLLLTKEVDGSVRPLSCARPTTARPASSPLVVERGTASVIAYKQTFGAHAASPPQLG